MIGQIPTLEALNLAPVLPAISVAAWAVILLLVDLWIPRARKELTAWLAAGVLIFAFVANLFTFNSNSDAFLGMFRVDSFTAGLNVAILVTGFIAILLSIDYIRRAGIERGEYYVMLLFTISGTMFMIGSNNLISIFVSLELLSIPLYVLAAWRFSDLKSEESGMKYFVLGAFSSAFFIYGAALVYGATSTTSLPEIFLAVERAIAGQGSSTLLLLVGSGLLLVGLGFKVAVVPFHTWTPDVYEGAPTPVTAFMSVGAKLGGFAALLRLMIVGLGTFTLRDTEAVTAWQNIVWIIAAATLILGNVVAISQGNMKRMLAYSSIAHAGYIMMAVAAAGTVGFGDQAARAVVVYLIAYMFTNLGAFAIVIALERNDGSGVQLENFIGLGRRRPLLAAMMAFFMLSLTGMPITAGFIGKLYVFQVVVQAGLVPLAVIGVLTTVVSAFYYLRIIVNMYLRDTDSEPENAAPGDTDYVRIAAYIAFAGTLLFGIIPAMAGTLADPVVLATLLPR